VDPGFGRKADAACGMNWLASIWTIVVATSCPNSSRCWLSMVVSRFGCQVILRPLGSALLANALFSFQIMTS
jgi:hypothetical protein